MRNFCLHLGVGANAAGLPFRKTRVSSESIEAQGSRSLKWDRYPHSCFPKQQKVLSVVVPLGGEAVTTGHDRKPSLRWGWGVVS